MYHQKIPGTDTNSTAAATSTTAAPDKGVLLALEAGWTVALLYGLPSGIPSPGEEPSVDAAVVLARRNERLPTEHELPYHLRVELERARLANLLKQMKALKTPLSSPQPSLPAISAEREASRHTQLQKFHFGMLTYLTSMGRDVGLAYELGRSLRDTADPPPRRAGTDTDGPTTHEKMIAMTMQLDPRRLAKIQGWLATLKAGLPDDSASIVSVSMGQ